MVGWRIALWAAIVLVALLFLWATRGILAPFVLAFLVAGLLEPTIGKMQARGMSRPVSVWIVFILFFSVVTTIGVWLTPMIAGQLAAFRDSVQSYSSQLASEANEQNVFVSWTPQALLSPPEPPSTLDKLFGSVKGVLQPLGITTRQEFVEKYVKPHQKQLTDAAQSFFNSLIGSIGAVASQVLLLVFTPIFVLLILMDMERFKARSASWIPPAIRRHVLDLVSDIFFVFIKYLRGVSIVVLWYVLVAGTLLTLLGAPYAILLAVLFALVYLIPLVGPIANAVMLFGFTALSGNTGNVVMNFPSSIVFAAVITIVYFVVMFLFDQAMFPKIVGSSVGLHPVASFFCIFAGGALFGAVGMLLAFPLAGAVKVILERLLRVTSSREGELGLPAVPMRHRQSQAG